MIPVNAGETLPTCPSRCADAIWTYFNDKWHAPPGEVREAVETFAALDLQGDARQIPAGARLIDVSLGPEQADSPQGDPKVAAFRYDGQVYFSSVYELFRKTIVVEK
ncbi:MAG TPA: hypothetical protein VMI94_02070 [Bryobacteraceae bacterium]|nr:hypothetical protein [Bryobacteraceae bacterium]